MMKSLTEYLVFKTKQKKEFVNITKDIERLVQKSGIKDGLCLVNAMHITASVFINDNESGLHSDYDNGLRIWHHIILLNSIDIMIQVRIMLMLILNAKLWDVRLLLQFQILI